MPIYQSVNGVLRPVTKKLVGGGGIVREVDSQYIGVNGATQKVYSRSVNTYDDIDFGNVYRTMNGARNSRLAAQDSGSEYIGLNGFDLQCSTYLKSGMTAYYEYDTQINSTQDTLKLIELLNDTNTKITFFTYVCIPNTYFSKSKCTINILGRTYTIPKFTTGGTSLSDSQYPQENNASITSIYSYSGNNNILWSVYFEDLDTKEPFELEITFGEFYAINNGKTYKIPCT